MQEAALARPERALLRAVRPVIGKLAVRVTIGQPRRSRGGVPRGLAHLIGPSCVPGKLAGLQQALRPRVMNL
jgi:hypothetical protein